MFKSGLFLTKDQSLATVGPYCDRPVRLDSLSSITCFLHIIRFSQWLVRPLFFPVKSLSPLGRKPHGNEFSIRNLYSPE